jgi:pimeloyl-ACP methyl ester carboxylesterase
MQRTILENGSFLESIGGRTIHYEVHGRGPVVMAVPNSWGLSVDGLRGFYRTLEDRVTMVYFDPRGMGESGPVEVDEDMGLAAIRVDFNALRVHLGQDRVHAIGWSNGAMNLILLAAEFPESLRSGVFVHGVLTFDESDMALWMHRQPELLQKMNAVMTGLEEGGVDDAEATRRLKSLWVEDFFPASCADPEATAPRLADLYRDVEFSWPHARYTNQETPYFDGRDAASHIVVPCLVLAGAHDNFSPDKVRVLADALEHSSFEVFENSGHFSPIEEPAAFRNRVFRFWGVE